MIVIGQFHSIANFYQRIPTQSLMSTLSVAVRKPLFETIQTASTNYRYLAGFQVPVVHSTQAQYRRRKIYWLWTKI